VFQQYVSKWFLPDDLRGCGVGLLTLAMILLDNPFAERYWLSIGEMGGLVLLACVMSVLWRQPAIGYGAALLFSLTVSLAFFHRSGFFWQWFGLPDTEHTIFGYALGFNALALFLISQGIRRFAQRYASPYEIVGYALLTAAPFFVLASFSHGTHIWAMMTVLYALATWRYRLPWVLAPTFLAFDVTAVYATGWLSPGDDPAGLGYILLAAGWLQALSGIWFRRRKQPHLAHSLHQQHARMAYGVAGVSAATAMLLASGNSHILALVAAGLTVLLVLVATYEQHSAVAASSLLTLAIGIGSLFHNIQLSVAWSLTWCVAVALALCLLGCWDGDLPMCQLSAYGMSRCSLAH
jgi:hypothetical protein